MDNKSSIYNRLRADGSLKKGILNGSLLTVLRQFMETGFSSIEINCKPEIREEVSNYLFKDFGEEWDYTNKCYEADDFVSAFEDVDLLEEAEDSEEGLDVVDFFEKHSDYEYESPKNPLSISMLKNDSILVEVENLSIIHGYDVSICEPRDGAECLKKSLERTKEKYPDISYFGYIAYDWFDENGGDVEEYIFSTQEVSDEEVYAFISKRISKAIEENPESFSKEVRRIIGIPLNTKCFSEEWNSLEKYLSKECNDIISRLVESGE